MGHDDHSTLDGNALAGALGEVFAVDLTSARVTCDHCGSVRVLAEGVAYVGGPGTVLRCTDCAGVLGRLVRSRGSVLLEIRGVAVLEVPVGRQGEGDR